MCKICNNEGLSGIELSEPSSIKSSSIELFTLRLDDYCVLSHDISYCILLYCTTLF